KRSVALAIRNMPSRRAKSRAMNSPSRAGETWPLRGRMTMVRNAAPRKSQAKKMRSGSCWIRPPKRGKSPQGVIQVASAVSASQKSAPTVSHATRRALRRTKRSWISIAITATVRTLSGQKNRSEVMLSMRGLLQRKNEIVQADLDEIEDRFRIEAEEDDQRAE